jgi:hypothetical protein
MLGVGEERRLLFLLALATALAACKADTPPLTDGDGNVDEECTPYADVLVAYTPAAGGSSDAGDNALGEPDDQVVTVATDDILTVGFIGLGAITDAVDVGDDIAIVSTDVDGTEVAVNLSLDGETWETAGTLLDGDTGIDIADTATLITVVYIQLVGVSGQLVVDSVQSLQTTCPTSVR